MNGKALEEKEDLLKTVKKLKKKIIGIENYYNDKKTKYKRETLITHSPFYKVRDLYGIALCRTIKVKGKNQHEVLMVCKKHTYAYATFLHMYYVATNEQYRKLFNEMTIEEKMDIYSMNFTQMWYRVWQNWRFRKYYLCKLHFEKTHMNDGGAGIKRMIYGTKNNSRIWEMPKGSKKDKNETPVSCSIRELEEETEIKKSEYYLTDKVITISYIDDGVLYKMHYTLAIQKEPIDISLFRGKDKYREISDIKWMNIELVRTLCKPNIADGIGRIFNIYKSIRQNYKL